RVLRRDYDKETKLPAALVEEIARETSLSQATWAEARGKSDFAAFAPHLEKVVALMKEKAACLGPDRKPYDVLLDLYEPGSTEASVAEVFGSLRKDLVSILGRIRSRPQVDDRALHAHCPKAAQIQISEWLMDVLAYDRGRGRLDQTAHPFTTTLGVDDIRITTRYLEDYLPSSVFSTMHETGHALYELGIDPAPGFRGTRLAEASSMAIHESQSRLWENIVGRSQAFWKPNYAKLRSLSGGSLGGLELEGFVRAVNKVEPSFIRTEADEVTYGLHVILRFELEAELISGRLAARDLPAAWNAKMKELLGIVPPDDARGCLQDVHWSAGLFGYFPSYSLGNLYAAQFWRTMRDTMPGLEAEIEAGRLGGLLSWLRGNIHRPGSTWLPGELVQRVTGGPLDSRHFVEYLGEKYARIYGF
ncbi:MAG TPA: carboxypeptidase M32, partial [Rectinemataceae bacterium]|nr:carboxypeptidase M32 [Rectinemataceae bacterium]